MSDYLKSDKAKSIWSSMRSGLTDDKEEKKKEKKEESPSRFARLKKYARSQFGKGFGSDQEDVKGFGKRLFK